MAKPREDPGLDTLLALDGVILVVDPNSAHWVKMVVKPVAPSPERPHGINYSLPCMRPTASAWSATTMHTPSAPEAGQGGVQAPRTIIATGSIGQGRMRLATRRL